MSNTETGGPAFPLDDGVHRGMDLRDYFAAKALTGLCANQDNRAYKSSTDFATVAYMLADAMLKARSKT